MARTVAPEDGDGIGGADERQIYPFIFLFKLKYYVRAVTKTWTV